MKSMMSILKICVRILLLSVLEIVSSEKIPNHPHHHDHQLDFHENFRENIQFSENAVYLRVLDLNTWGLSWPFSKDRDVRFRALRTVLSQSTYDVVLLQELWFRDDHNLLTSASLPYSNHFGTFNSDCKGYILPLECSGLTILSRYPFVELEFTPFKKRGSFWSFDGEIFVQKGLARARISLNGINIDLFTTHLVSYTKNPSVYVIFNFTKK